MPKTTKMPKHKAQLADEGDLLNHGAECPPEVWGQLWNVVDAARMAVRPVRGQEREDALEFLADQEKMLRRALGFFAGRHEDWEHHEGYLRRKVDTHPYVLEMQKQDRDIFHEGLVADGYVLQSDGTYKKSPSPIV